MRKSRMKSYKFDGVGNRKVESELRWFLRFINEDLTSLDTKKFQTLFRQVLIFFYGARGIDNSNQNIGVSILVGRWKHNVSAKDNRLNREALGQFQEVVRHYISLVMESFDLSSNSKSPVLVQDYKFVKFRMEYSVELLSDRLEVIPESNLLFRRQFRDLETKAEKLLSGTLVFSSFVDNHPEQTVQSSASRLLTNFPLSSIRLCNQCLKRYYYISNRKKKESCEKCVIKERVSHWRERDGKRDKRNRYERNRRLESKRREIRRQEDYELFLKFSTFIRAAKENSQDTEYVGPYVIKLGHGSSKNGWKMVDTWLSKWSKGSSLQEIWQEFSPEIKALF